MLLELILPKKPSLVKNTKARDYVNGTTVTLIPYEQEPLYNVVLIKHGFMKVHGMMVETLDPYVAKHRPKHPLQLK